MFTGAPMRRIALSSIIAILLLISAIPYPLAVSSTVEDYHIFYFRGGLFPHLSKYPPQGEEDKTTLDGTFMLNNVTSIKNGISFDLYFKVFPLNFSPILEVFLIMVTAISNMTVEQPKENRTIGEILEDLFRWNETGLNISEVESVIKSIIETPALNYTISIEIGNVSVTKTVTVCKQENETGLEDILSNFTLSNILNNLDYIIALAQGEANVVHKELTVEKIDVNVPEGDTLSIRIFTENESLQEIAPIIETVRYANESLLQSFVKIFFESHNLTRYTNIASKFIETLKWLAEFLSKNMGFVYDSYKHPSNIRFFGSVAGSEKYGVERYYLRKVKVDDDYALILDKKTIETNDTQQMNISSNMVRWISSEPFKEPTRIYGNVTAHLYIKCESWVELGCQYPIEVSLYDKKGDSLSKIASGVAGAFIYTHLLAPQPLDVVIEDVDHTFEEGHYLVMGIRMVNRTLEFFGIEPGVELVFLRPLLLFNSKNYSSYIEIPTAPLDDIKLKFLGNTTISPEIKRVGSAHYNIEVTNRGETGDNLTLSLDLIDKNGIWPDGWRAEITILNSTENADFSWEKQVYISGKGTIKISIDVYPSPDAEDESEAYMIFSATGSYRGSDSISDKIRIKMGKPRAEFTSVPNDKKVEVGSTFKYTFRVKNVGNDVDDFVVNATSEHGWIVGDSAFVIEDLYPGNETEFSIILKIPGNLSSTPVEDDLIVQVSPESRPSAGDEAWIVTTAVEISTFEKIGRFFGGISNSLKEKLGETGYMALIALIIIVILLILFFSIYMVTRKYAELICLDRIKELSPGKEARFEVTVRNPSKMRLSYDVYLDKDVIQEGWVADLSEKEFVLDPGEERKVFVHVKATERIDPDGFSRIRLVVIPKEKPKAYSIDLLVTSKNATVDLKIEKVSHSPKRFKSGETVTTKFILRNDGTVMAKNVRVSLRVNGEEVNSANIDEIPPGSYAEVEMPWIAYLGRNDIAITAEM